MDSINYDTNELFKRQKDLFNPNDFETTAHVFGCGTIGSFTAVALAKLGISRICLYDFDKVELHNISNQFFKTMDIGSEKTLAVERQIRDFIPFIQVEIFNEKIANDSELEFKDGDIVILAFDNLEARKIVYHKAFESGKKVSLIDARMGAELLRIYVLKDLKPDADFERSLNAKVAPVICSERSICYNGVMTAGLIASLVKKILKNEQVPREINFHLKNYGFEVV